MLRIATFNIENLDDKSDYRNPSLDIRGPVLRQMLNRLGADILCLQEVHGQELPDHTSNNPSRHLSALDTVLQGTAYESYVRAHTVTSDNVPYNERNLVVLSRFPIHADNQYRNDLIDAPHYKKVTAQPPEDEADIVRWERPIQHVEVDHPHLGRLHLINLHLKSRLASNIPGQKNRSQWHSASGWAEGYFLSSIKRVGQALEARQLVDNLFAAEPEAKIIVCGDFNAEPGEVPVEAICGSVENTNNPALQAKVLVPCSRNIPDSVRFSHLHHGQKHLLDHMLISSTLLPYFHSASLFNETLHDESQPFAFDAKFPESDHAPFLALFEW